MHDTHAWIATRPDRHTFSVLLREFLSSCYPHALNRRAAGAALQALPVPADAMQRRPEQEHDVGARPLPPATRETTMKLIFALAHCVQRAEPTASEVRAA
jgi:hypothetical protein